MDDDLTIPQIIERLRSHSDHDSPRSGRPGSHPLDLAVTT
jgi:hypothetical protein